MSWTDEQVALMLKLRREGKSLGQIARHMGVTRNVVTGKLTRLAAKGVDVPRFDFCTKPKAAARAPFHKRPKSPTPHDAPVQEINPALAAPVAASPKTRPALAPSRATPCQWPIGDPLRDDFRFCGQAASGSYCPRHAAVAYAPKPSPAKQRDFMRGLRRYA